MRMAGLTALGCIQTCQLVGQQSVLFPELAEHMLGHAAGGSVVPVMFFSAEVGHCPIHLAYNSQEWHSEEAT
jgi:hypothetical protein